jgi:hypothetical protein
MLRVYITLSNAQDIAQEAWTGFQFFAAIHNEPRYYNKPDVRFPFRFLSIGPTRQSMLVTPSNAFLPFAMAG